MKLDMEHIFGYGIFIVVMTLIVGVTSCTHSANNKSAELAASGIDKNTINCSIYKGQSSESMAASCALGN